ncbi:hypothetical protein [Methanobrevibacter sp.]|uniref:hypothetical protein n=1 Tax=Methanobrevibacter sp. TaxID=66852 RepID=UPI0025F9C500|nr:hypothetical protein [Methanobrevibacter sp.]MBQ2832694.1 hypothetical protein [Methanobrevibacter sp.]
MSESSTTKLNYRDLTIFLVPVLIFSLYVYIYNPGILTAASYGQLHQIAAGEFTGAYPLLHTLIVMACLKINPSPITVAIVHTLVFSVMWAAICKYHRNDSDKSSNEFVLQFFLTLIICLIPINAIYSVTLTSNVLFSYFLMFLCFLIKVMIDEKGQMTTKLAVLMALTLAIISGLNYWGIFVALLSLIAIIFYLARRGNSKGTILKLAGLTIILLLAVGSLNSIYDVKSGDSSFPMTDSFADSVNLEDAKSEFFSSIGAEPTAGFEDATSANAGNGKYNLIDSFVNHFRENFILNNLFANPIVYMILSIVLLAALFYMTGLREMLLVFVPNLINIIVVFATGQSNMYSNILVFYLIAVIFISAYLNRDTFTNVAPTSPRKEREPANLESQISDLSLDEINQMLNDSSSEGNYNYGAEPDPSDEILEDTQSEENHLYTQQPEPMEEIPQEPQAKTQEPAQGDGDDLLEQILKEIEMEKK